MIYHIVAMAENRVIGKDNTLPWHFSEDLKHFKALTSGHTVIMGRKTYESIGRPLPNRENFVLSRSASSYAALSSGVSESLKTFSSIESALQAVKTEQAFIIGGSNLYEQTIQLVDGIYLTQIHAHYEGDAFYPEIPEGFEEKERKVLLEEPKIEVIYYENVKSKEGVR